MPRMEAEYEAMYRCEDVAYGIEREIEWSSAEADYCEAFEMCAVADVHLMDWDVLR